MDLLGDLGQTDQLASERAENKVMRQRVKDLTMEIHKLRVENQSLLAEVEMYRADALNGVGPKGSKSSSGGGGGEEKSEQDAAIGDEFISSGNGIYPSDPAVTLKALHGVSNPLCCALNQNDTLLASGGADCYLSLCTWGTALSPQENAAKNVVDNAARIRCDAPVICCAFSGATASNLADANTTNLVAAGCMDGSVQIAAYDNNNNNNNASKLSASSLTLSEPIKHVKYVRTVAFSPASSLLASASANGTVRLTKIKSVSSLDDVDITTNKPCAETEEVKTLHLSGPVEAMCFLDSGKTLCCYVRNTSYLSYFDLEDGCKLSKHTLNGTAATGGFDDHVSFAIMDLAPSPDNGGKYLAAATDVSRNIIMEAGTPRQIRNLYGHKNDGFSQPKLAWSSNGQYIFGNTQEDNSVCVWDIASSSIVKRLDDKNCSGHTGQIRDLYSSSSSDTVVTASYDKTVKVWLQGM